MPNILEYPKQISLSHGLIVICVLYFSNTFSYLYSIFRKALCNLCIFFKSCLIQAKYTLQKSTYSKKHSIYTLEALKSSLIIQKSTQKQSKALVKHSPSSLFTIYSVLFQAVSHLIPML